MLSYKIFMKEEAFIFLETKNSLLCCLHFHIIKSLKVRIPKHLIFLANIKLSIVANNVNISIYIFLHFSNQKFSQLL